MTESPRARHRFQEPSGIPRLAKAWATAIPAAIGAFGLYQNAQAQKQQSKYIGSATSAAKNQAAAEQQSLQLANQYIHGGQQAEDAGAITSANQGAQQALGRDLQGYKSQFEIGGGSPTGDTAFNMGANNVINQRMDPVREFAANLHATATQREQGSLNSVYNAPAGSIANTYFQAANMTQPSYGPSLNLLTQAFQKAGQTAVGSGVNAVGQGVGDAFFGGPAAPKVPGGYAGTGQNWTGSNDTGDGSVL